MRENTMARPFALKLALTLVLLAVAGIAALIPAAGPAHAYSYAAAGAEPLLDGREALFGAAAAGDWAKAATALAAMKPDIDYLEGHEVPGIEASLGAAIAAKDAKALQAAFTRAAAGEIERRINGARGNLADYQTAKVLIVKAQRFYTAIAADLPADASKALAAAFPHLLDAAGNPGVFGVGKKSPDPAAFEAARADIFKALGLTP
jgi:hypothetical protein